MNLRNFYLSLLGFVVISGSLAFYFESEMQKIRREHLQDRVLERLQRLSLRAEAAGNLLEVLKDQRLGALFSNGNRVVPEGFPPLSLALPTYHENLAGLIVPCQNLSQETSELCALQPLRTQAAFLVDLVPSAAFSWKRFFLSVFLSTTFGVLLILLLLRKAPLRELSDEIERALASGDLTSRVSEATSLGRHLNRMFEQLSQRDRENLKLLHTERLATIGQMGTSLAHEIKNPLMAIQGFAKMLVSELKNFPDLREKADLIQKEAERSNQILSQLLRFARPDSDTRQTYALKDVLDSVLLLAQLEAKSKNIALSPRWDESPVLEGRPTRVQQILLNLVMNAIQASPVGSRIGIRVHQANSQSVLVDVQDHGPGIPKELQPRIFEPFFTTKREGEGTGMGLWLSSDLAQQEGGFLSFVSQPGEGTKFRLQLPALTPSSQVENIRSDESSHHRG